MENTKIMENPTETIEFKNDLPVKEVEYKKIIAEKKAAYMTLTISGIDDKEGYKAVHDARMDVKDIRVKAGKYCKQGRDELNAYIDINLKVDKEIKIGCTEIEEYLQAQTDKIDAENERIKNAELQARMDQVRQYSNTIQESLVKGLSPVMFETFLANIKKEYEEEKIRVAEVEAKIKAEEERRERQHERVMQIAPIMAYGKQIDVATLGDLSDEEYCELVANKQTAYGEYKAAEKAKEDAEKKMLEDKEAERKFKAERFVFRKQAMIDLGFEYREHAEYNFISDFWSCFQEQIEEPADKEFNSYMEAVKTAKRNKEEKAQIEADKKALFEAKKENRVNTLKAIGLVYSKAQDELVYGDKVSVTMVELMEMEQSEFESATDTLNSQILEQKHNEELAAKVAEEKRLQDIETAKQAAADAAVKAEQYRVAKLEADKEAARLKEEVKAKRKAELAPDKDKMQFYIDSLNAIPVPVLKSKELQEELNQAQVHIIIATDLIKLAIENL